MIRFPLLLLCLLLSVACGRRHTAVTDPEFSATAPGDSLHAVRIPVGGDFLGEYPVLTLGERIVMQNPFRLNKCYSVCRFSGDSLVKEGEFLMRGRGPLEMMIPQGVFDPEAERLTVFGLYNGENRMLRIGLGDLYDPSQWEYGTLDFLEGYQLESPCRLTDTAFLTIGHTVESFSPFSILDPGGERVTPLDFRFPEPPLDLPASQQAIFWTGWLHRHPQRSRFLYSSQNFRYLLVFDVTEDGRVEVVRRLYDKMPEAHPSGDPGHQFDMDDSCPHGFFPLAVDDRFIYVGYMQDTYGEQRERVRAGDLRQLFPSRINVYDWDGNFVRRLVLDRPVGPMVVHDGRLIAWSVDPETAEEMLVSYTL